MTLRRSLHLAALFGAALTRVACSNEGTSPASAGAGPPGGPSAGAIEDRLHAPAGFKVTYFARDLPGARFMALGPDGSVYVSQTGSGKVTRLFDADGDGVADVVTAVLSGLDLPHGLAIRKGFLYVATLGGVARVALANNGGVAGTPQQLNHYSTDRSDHITRTIVFGSDGAMYVSIGSTCNLCVEKSPDQAAVMRYDEDGQNGAVFASGLRNAVGLAVNPTTGQIWATVNERDNLPPNWQDLPPDEIDLLEHGADYGWPYCYGQRIPNPEFNDPARCTSTTPPALELPAHAAPLGITFLQHATQLPEEYRDDALVAYHGSWNRNIPVAPRIVRIHQVSGLPTQASDFVTGWQNANGSRWGRPVDVLVYRDGSILVSDDQAGVVYRVAR